MGLDEKLSGESLNTDFTPAAHVDPCENSGAASNVNFTSDYCMAIIFHSS
jgi:hypothetical protein